MKKFTAIILALLLMFSLSITALAAGSSTNVTVSVDSSNLSVTVPLTLAITAKVNGGTATAGGYTFVNNSAVPVKVDSITVTLNNKTDWAFKGTAIAEDTDPTANGVNDIYLSINGQVIDEQTASAPTTASAWNITAGASKTMDVICSTSKLDQTTAATNLITIVYVISAGTAA